MTGDEMTLLDELKKQYMDKYIVSEDDAMRIIMDHGFGDFSIELQKLTEKYKNEGFDKTRAYNRALQELNKKADNIRKHIATPSPSPSCWWFCGGKKSRRLIKKQKRKTRRKKKTNKRRKRKTAIHCGFAQNRKKTQKGGRRWPALARARSAQVRALARAARAVRTRTERAARASAEARAFARTSTKKENMNTSRAPLRSTNQTHNTTMHHQTTKHHQRAPPSTTKQRQASSSIVRKTAPPDAQAFDEVLNEALGSIYPKNKSVDRANFYNQKPTWKAFAVDTTNNSSPTTLEVEKALDRIYPKNKPAAPANFYNPEQMRKAVAVDTTNNSSPPQRRAPPHAEAEWVAAESVAAWATKVETGVRRPLYTPDEIDEARKKGDTIDYPAPPTPLPPTPLPPTPLPPQRRAPPHAEAEWVARGWAERVAAWATKVETGVRRPLYTPDEIDEARKNGDTIDYPKPPIEVDNAIEVIEVDNAIEVVNTID